MNNLNSVSDLNGIPGHTIHTAEQRKTERFDILLARIEMFIYR